MTLKVLLPILNSLICLTLTVAAAQGVALPFPPERGPLHIEGRFFKTSDGVVWDWRGASMFTLFARYLRGEDITPQLRWCRAHGVNVIRVFGQLSGEGGWADWPDNRRPWERADFAIKLGTFFDLVGSNGLRVEFTVLTFPDDTGAMRSGLQRTYDVAAGRWNVMIEAANEPTQQGIDVLAAMRSVDRHGVLSAYGLYPAEPAEPAPAHLEYVTVHTSREKDFAPHAADLRDIRVGPASPPVIGDEPIGVAEREEAGRRTTSAQEMARYMAICRLVAAGCTLHLQVGLDGRTPTAEREPVQSRVGDAVLRVWKAIPGIAQACEHLTSGATDRFPVIPGDGESLRAAVCSPEAYVVPATATGRSWSPRPANGWQLVGHPSPVVAMLKR